ncbi:MULTISPECIES: phosphotransferase family protein [Paenibacillus]|uniref:phosphotransferase family protein n=1 Tax=Paenibacillus TaxID=44249 RepID=UPI0011A6511B|nr:MULTISPECIES: phosphotransferase [Paenibacillus]MBJ9992758.1 phosphotransferase [Paenibacillus sp. S28]
MYNLSQFVLPNGTLSGEGLWKRETLYQGMNGKFVERFYPDRQHSYIFKPLTNGESVDREAWIYRHMLSGFPDIYPALLASSEEGAGEEGWSIFEDLGPLRHEYDVETAMKVVQQIAWWHALPEECREGLSGSGPKPQIEQIAADLMNRRDEAVAVMNEIGEPWELDGMILSFAEGRALPKIKVVSHGDLHLGNYAVAADGRLYIMDWEHAHLNTPFWDLYHLIDMSHPLFPKQVTAEDREKLLTYYVAQSALYGAEWDLGDFIRDYCRFATVFSIWMLLLISGDLKRGDSVWPQERLLAQKEEAIAGLKGCLTSLSLERDSA